jgi:hypothetical protein
MTKEDYRLLELLLGKLETEIGNKICIIPNYVHDGYYINVYDGKHGTSLNSTIAATIELAVENLKQQSNEQPITKGNK